MVAGLVLLLQLLLLPAGTAEAARRDHVFRHLGSADGLAQNTILGLAQDRFGFVWVATQGGLHRYDGYRFDRFEHDPADPESLPENFVTALATDPDGQLWVGTNSRFVARLDPATRRFQRFEGALTGDLRRDGITALRSDGKGGLWLGTQAGIEHFDPATGERRELLRLSPAPRVNRAGMPRSIDFRFDAEGVLWAATESGLFRIDPNGRSYQRVGDPVPSYGMLGGDAGRIWIGRLDGLWRLDPAGRLEQVRDGAGAPIPATWRIASDPQGRLWLALLDGGLLRFDPHTRATLRIDYRPEIPGGLHERVLANLMVDRGGLLWVGGMTNGLATTPTYAPRFLFYTDTQPGPDPIGSANIRTIWQQDARTLWLGSENGGLHEVDLVTGAFRNHFEALRQALPVATRGRALRVLGLAPGDGGHLWVSTDQGAFDFDLATGRAVRVYPEGDALATDASNLRYALRTRDGSVWFGTFGNGLLQRRPDGSWRTWEHRADDPGTLSHPLVNHIFEDSQGLLWVSTLHGLNLLDPQTGRVRRILADPADPESLSGNLVRGVLEASDGRIWVATHSGISASLGDPRAERPRFQHLGEAQGLPGGTVYGLLEDAVGRIWVSSNRGLLRFDPRNGNVQAFGLSDGLQDLEFNGGAQLALSDGRLAFGGIRGLNVFDPEAIHTSRFAPPVVLVGLRVGSGPELAPRHDDAPIRLDQTARVYRFRFAALDYTAPERNRFQYRLEGFDREWIDTGTLPEATYTNLDAGHYRLRVRATNHDGAWSSHELDLPLEIVPPWWNDTPARLAYLVLLLAFVAWLTAAVRRRRRQERALIQQVQEREERLKLALWGSGDEFWDWDLRENRLYRIGANQLLGGDAFVQEVSTDDWRKESVHPDDLPKVQERLQAHLAGRVPAYESEHRIRNARGEWIWVRARGKVVARDEHGHPLRIAGTARDISAERAAEGERRIASEVLRSMGEAVAVTDLDFCFVSVNPAFSSITGYSEEEVRGVSASLLDSVQHGTEFHRKLRETVARSGHWKGEIWQRRKAGDEFLAQLEINEVCDAYGVRTHYVAVISDITDRKRAEQELLYLANYDTLTGLPNRTLLHDRLARAVVRARRHRYRLGLLFLDLDRFKDINDSLGHAAGDRILKSAAARLLATVRESDTVARLGGDEFTVLLEELHEPAAAEQMAMRIIEAFSTPLQLDGRSEIVISPSIGIALFPDHAEAPADLLKCADTAMYAAKDRGRNTWQMYSEALDAETRRRAAMLSALRRALEREEFRLVFQPRQRLADGRIVGFEALLRWDSSELGPVAPAEFIPLAEETGLILPIGEWVLRQALAVLRRWREAGVGDGLVMSVNVSMLQFLRDHLEETVARAVQWAGVPASALEIEVTESLVMANAERAIRVLHALKEMGVSIAVDDFGTGYSSLVYLKRLPIHTLKIDKEFVGDLSTDPDDAAITATIIAMAHSLGLRVVAEGVETGEQLDYLRRHGCDEIQGYWLARPMPEADCLASLQGKAGS
ncbi:MAG: diguanylate cyclase [Lysobacteraceae bacterium]|nr:MAG: diguanylate cyclase [Xanthomonadaceae bacterium]